MPDDVKKQVIRNRFNYWRAITIIGSIEKQESPAERNDGRASALISMDFQRYPTILGAVCASKSLVFNLGTQIALYKK